MNILQINKLKRDGTYRMRFEPVDDAPGYREAICEKVGCNETVGTYRGADAYCDCGAIYNAFGQRLRDDLNSRRNYSDTDDIGDMEGYENAYANDY